MVTPGYLLGHRSRPAKRIATAVAADDARVMVVLRAFGATVQAGGRRHGDRAVGLIGTGPE